jgi:molybdopterin-guanine dinucleotide biosynthesis protein
MDMQIDSTRPYHPNILTISGTGRNVGKTTLACSIIEKLAQNARVTSIKITPHYHEVDYPSMLFQQPDAYSVYLEERKDRKKDSSKMLAAGAHRVLFIQAHDKYLEDLWKKISGLLNSESPVIVESGGIHKIIRPGIAFLLSADGEKWDKHNDQKEFIEIQSDRNHFDSILKRIDYIDGCWKYQ